MYHQILKIVEIKKIKITRHNNYKRNQHIEEITITRIQTYGTNLSIFIIKIQISVDHIIKEITTITNNKMIVNVLKS